VILHINENINIKILIKNENTTVKWSHMERMLQEQITVIQQHVELPVKYYVNYSIN